MKSKFISKALFFGLITSLTGNLTTKAYAQFYSMGQWAFSHHGGGDDISLTGDFDGDGTDDIANFTRGGSGDVHVKLSQRDGFGANSIWHYQFCYGTQIPLVGDFNGDGKDDIVTFGRGTTADVYVATSTGSSFSGTGVKWHTDFCHGTETPLVGDFNGDGFDDIATLTGGSTAEVYVALSNGSSFGSSVKWSNYTAPNSDLPLVGDFNGDGKDDIVSFTRGTAGDVYVSISNGISFNYPLFWHDWFCPYSEIPGVGDFNGDGKDDVVTFTRGSSADVYIALSTGGSFNGTGVKWHDNFASGTNSIPAVGDFNGLGKSDIVSFYPNSAVDVAVAEQKSQIYFGMEPFENGKIRFLRRADYEQSLYYWADFAFRINFINQHPNNKQAIDKVTYQTNHGYYKEANADLLLDKGASFLWNINTTDRLIYKYYYSSPPTSITIKVYTKGVPEPNSYTFSTGPHESANDETQRSYLFPGKKGDIGSGNYWRCGFPHANGGQGSQLFAYDIGVVKWDGNAWSELYDEKDGTSNSHYRIWNKPIYAMADGTVIDVEFDKNDKVPGGATTDRGNLLYIQHGDEVVLYAHLKKNTIPTHLRTVGANVTKGEMVGRAGNSGSTSHPHLHIHAIKGTAPEVGPLRPLPFYGAKTIEQSLIDVNNQEGSNWIQMYRTGLTPGLGLIYPIDSYHPSLVTSNDENKNQVLSTKNKDLTVFPNPVLNGNTTITFGLEKENNVSIKIIDQLGKEVQTINQGKMSKGNHKINWDSSNLVNGVYMVLLKNGETTKMKKVVIQK